MQQLDTGNRNMMDVTASPQLRIVIKKNFYAVVQLCFMSLVLFDDMSGMCGPVPPLPLLSSQLNDM